MRVILKSDKTNTPIDVVDSCIGRNGEPLLGLDGRQVSSVKGAAVSKKTYWVEFQMVFLVSREY